MKQLTNYCPVMNYAKEIEAYSGKMTGYCKDNKIDGIELYLYGTEPFAESYREDTVGVHLKYWPSWMDFWCGNNSRLDKFFPDVKARRQYYLGAETKEQWLEIIRANIKAALTYEPEYLVWHVAECDLENIYTWDFTYNSKQVLQATVEVYKEVADCIPQNVLVLFENLWWPGLTLKDSVLTGEFFEALTRHTGDNIGVMLDTGHLMNTNPGLETESEGVGYILETGRKLGSLKQLVKGFHLSCSLSGAYQREFRKAVNSCSDWSFPTDSLVLMNHITSIDQHRPFKDTNLAPLVDFYMPSYINHELFYDNMEQLAKVLQSQRCCIGG